jgi:hypothetical protein
LDFDHGQSGEIQNLGRGEWQSEALRFPSIEIAGILARHCTSNVSLGAKGADLAPGRDILIPQRMDPRCRNGRTAGE